MKDRPTNLAASVLARLKNVAREKNTDYQFIQRRYAIERLLHRLSLSPHRDQFILKGAMLFTAWLSDPFRPTQDLDLLGYGDPTTSVIEVAFKAICATQVEEDGLVFSAEDLVAEPIRRDQQYGGVRVKTKAFLGKAKIPIQIDVGFGDAVTPEAEMLEFPSLLSPQGPRLRAYPKETVVAEKLQAIVALGMANSRMKDFYDLLTLSRLFDFHGETLTAAIRATFERRQTPLPTTMPVGLSEAFANDDEKARQWSAFIRRQPLLVEGASLKATIEEIEAFVSAPLKAAALNKHLQQDWPSGGPWKACVSP